MDYQNKAVACFFQVIALGSLIFHRDLKMKYQNIYQIQLLKSFYPITDFLNCVI